MPPVVREEEKDMEMKQLQYFVVSAEAGSLSKAAELLYTTQPHVSMTIQKLESSLGVPLLKRSKKGVVMTKEGELVYEQVREILKSLQTIQDVKNLEKKEPLLVAAMPSSCFAGIFASFYAKAEGMQAGYWEGALDKVIHRTAHRQAQVGLVFISSHQKKASERL